LKNKDGKQDKSRHRKNILKARALKKDRKQLKTAKGMKVDIERTFKIDSR